MSNSLNLEYMQLNNQEENISNFSDHIKIKNLIDLIEFLSIIDKNKKNKEIKKETDECVKKLCQADDFYKNLGELPKLSINIDTETKHDIDCIMNMQFSSENMYNLSMKNFDISMPEHIGLIRLFIILINNDNENLVNFLKNRNRYDLKIVYLKILFSIYSIEINNEEFYKSNFDFIRMYYMFQKYRLSNHSIIYCNDENIDKLFSLEISKRDKFLVYLYYLRRLYHGKTIVEIAKDYQIKDCALKLFSLDYEFSEQEFFPKSIIYYAQLYYVLISYIKDIDKKSNLFASLFNDLLYCLVNKIVKNDFCSFETDFQIAIVLGLLAFNLDETFYQTLQKRFEMLKKELSFPYTFCMNENWCFHIAYMFCFLLAISVYKKNKNISFVEEIKVFECLLGEHQHYLRENFNLILQKLKESTFFSITLFDI